jgi:hypothetical protein
MPQLAFAGGQAVGDVAQAVDRAQLTKQHRHQLAPAGEPFGVAFGSVLVDGGIEVRRGISFKTWEKMLHTVDKAASSSEGQVLDKPNLSDRCSLASISTYCWKLRFWTRVIMNELYRRMANRTENYVFLKMTALYNLLHKLFL